MYCIRCGKKLEDGVKYCTRCGAPVITQTRGRTGIPTQEEQREDAFTIRIPQDDMQAEAAQNIQHMMEQASAPDEVEDNSFTRTMVREEIKEMLAQGAPEMQPDEVEDDSFTRAMAREEIKQAMAPDAPEAQPDEVEDDSATRAMAREEIKQVMAGTMEEQPDEAEDEEYTRVIAREDIHAALADEQQEQAEEEPPLDVNAIPDIPIPSDFVAQEAPRYYTPPAPYVPAEHTVHRLAQEEEEPLMSRRGLVFVVLVVILFFAIAVGAFVLALNSTGTTDTGSGAGSAEVGFWSSDDNG